MEAIVIGAGKIGRGFIGPILFRAGFSVTFADTNPALVCALRERDSYPLRRAQGKPVPDEIVRYAGVIDARNEEAESAAIENADILAVCVGAKNLQDAARPLAKGFERRLRRGKTPINLLICENLIDADAYLRGIIEGMLPKELLPAFRETVGLVDASVSIAVPIQTLSMLDGDPLRVCTERHIPLPIDADAVRGTLPDIPGIEPSRPFTFYMRRKLFVHNMGHAVCAYLGLYIGCEYMHEAMRNPYIHLCVHKAMLESACALSRAFQMPLDGLIEYIDDLLERFMNERIADTCERVGADPERKLQPDDRLLGAMALCRAQGVSPAYIALGAAGGYRALGKPPEDIEIASLYKALLCGEGLGELLSKAENAASAKRSQNR